MTIRTVLHHRADVVRAVVTAGDRAWGLVAADMPCLVTTGTKGEAEDRSAAQEADRLGLVFTLPDSPVTTGDRLLVKRGPVGIFKVEPNPANVGTLRGNHHREHQITGVPAGVDPGPELPLYSTDDSDLVATFRANL